MHEPPLFSLLDADPSFTSMLADVKEKIGVLVERIASGDHAGAAAQFVETVALGSGTWAELTSAVQQMHIANAPTFLDETNGPEQLAFDLDSIRAFSKPALLTLGDRSPPLFAPVVARIAQVLPHAEVVTVAGAGHIPHTTHASAYADAIVSFIDKQVA
jgi:pimeloyl-ACP methyl ester carboxylesterase